jgi:hypothetical protein
MCGSRPDFDWISESQVILTLFAWKAHDPLCMFQTRRAPEPNQSAHPHRFRIDPPVGFPQ